MDFLVSQDRYEEAAALMPRLLKVVYMHFFHKMLSLVVYCALPCHVVAK